MAVFKRWNGTSWEIIGPTISNSRINTVEELIAPEYDSNSAYSVGDFVVYSDTLYKCNTAIDSGGELWNSTHWTETKIGDEVSDLKSALNDIEKNTRVGQEYPFVDNGYVNSSGVINNNARAKNTGYIKLTGLKSISYKVNLSASAYGLAFYDSNKNFLSSISITGGTSGSVSTVTLTDEILQSAEYFVVSHYYDTSILWSPECYVTSADYTFDARIDELETEAVKQSDITTYIGINKFNPNAVQTGKEIYSDGSLHNQANSASSDFIYVHGKQKVYLKNLPSYSVADLNRYYFFYDENKDAIGSYQTIDKLATNYNISIPATAYYFRFSIYQRVPSESLPIDYSRVMVTTEYTNIEFEEYGKYISEINDYKIPQNNGQGFNVSGLKVLIFGDSITETASMNDDGTNYTEGTRSNWPKYAKNIMGWKSFKNYAKSGAAYKDRGSGYEYRQTVANQIALAMADSNNDDADIVVFSLGTNDGTGNLGSYETAMGKTTLESLDQTKLYEALRFAYWTVKTKYKNAMCFAAIPIQRADIEPPTALYQAITEMAHRYNFIVINGAYQSGIIKENNVWQSTGNDLYDGLHPNTVG